MSAQELGRCTAADLAHLLPERDRGARVVTRLGRELDADLVSLVLGRAAVRQLYRELRRRRRGRHRLARVVGQHAGGEDPRIARERHRHALGCVVRECVRDLVPHDLREFIVGRVDLLDQPGVDRHAAARHAPGVDGLRVVDDLHAPLPLGALGAHPDGLAHEPLGDHFDAVQQPRVGHQLAFLLVLAHFLRVRLARGADRLLLGHQHQLLAPGGARRTGGDDQRRCEGEQRLADVHSCTWAWPAGDRRMMHRPGRQRKGTGTVNTVRRRVSTGLPCVFAAVDGFARLHWPRVGEDGPNGASGADCGLARLGGARHGATRVRAGTDAVEAWFGGASRAMDGEREPPGTGSRRLPRPGLDGGSDARTGASGPGRDTHVQRPGAAR
jgi:hypothetical protein